MRLNRYRRIDHRHRRELVVALLATALTVIAIMLYLLKSSYDDEMHAAETATRNYAAVVETRLESTLRRVDADTQHLIATIPPAALDVQAVPRFAAAPGSIRCISPSSLVRGFLNMALPSTYTSRSGA